MSSGWAAANLNDDESSVSSVREVRAGQSISSEGIAERDAIARGVGLNQQCTPSDRDRDHSSVKKTSSPKRVRTETSEAALARLTNAYATALQCVASIQRLDGAMVHLLTESASETKGGTETQADNIQKSTRIGKDIAPCLPQDKSSQNLTSSVKGCIPTLDRKLELETKIRELATSARSIFELSLFSDPSVIPTIPNLIDELNDVVLPSKRSPMISFSSSQRKNLSKLVYLALTNYADLLSSCACDACKTAPKKMRRNPQDILDKGVAKKMKYMASCIWSKIPQKLVEENDGDSTDKRESASKDGDSGADEEALITRLRCVLFSLVDATEYDGSDPTIWLKVACAGRALENREADEWTFQKAIGHRPRNGRPMDYRSIEKLAINRGISLFSPSLDVRLQPVPPKISGPPNRLLVLALDSLIQKDANEVVSSLQPMPQSEHKLSIQLPRYSWNALGRNIMRACRDLSSFPSTVTYRISGTSDILFEETTRDASFPSPSVVLAVSPLLAYTTVPIIGRICSYLNGGTKVDVQNLEWTCRAMSSAVLGASALKMDHPLETKPPDRDSPIIRPPDVAEGDSNGSRPGSPVSPKRSRKKAEMNEDSTDLPSKQSDAMVLPLPPPTTSPSRMTRISSRSSSRVRSQRLSQDQRGEKSNRMSVEYCLVASVFGCKVEHPAYRALSTRSVLLGGMRAVSIGSTASCTTTNWDKDSKASLSVDWLDLASLRGLATVAERMHGFQKTRTKSICGEPSQESRYKSMSAQRRHIEEQMTVRIGDSSLVEFIRCFSGKNCEPLNMLSIFVHHVSNNVETAFSGEEDSMLLSSCVLDCFETLFNSSRAAKFEFVPFWIGDVTPTDVIRYLKEPEHALGDDFMETYRRLFSANLLVAELKLRRCERQPNEIFGIEGDAAAVSFVVPMLLKISNLCKKKNNVSEDAKWFCKLQARLHWLASAYCRWCGRSCQDASEAAELEKLAIEHIESCICWLNKPEKGPIQSVKTPHLESPSRTGPHWSQLEKVALLAYKSEIQAASVVNHARLRFQEIARDLEASSRSSRVETFTQNSKLEEVGRDLMKRYDVEYEGRGGVHEEIVLEFLTAPKIKLLLLKSARKARRNEIEGCMTYSRPLGGQSGDSCGNQAGDKWGKDLWDTLPLSLSETMKNQSFGDRHFSIITLLGICASSCDTLAVPFLKLLISLALSSLDQRSQSLSNDGNNDRGDSSDFNGTERPLEAPNTEDLNQESNNEELAGDDTVVIRDDEIFLLLAEFLMDKISILIKMLLTEKNSSRGVNCDAVEAIICDGPMKALLYSILNIASCADEKVVDNLKLGRESSEVDSIATGFLSSESFFAFEDQAQPFGQFPRRRLLSYCCRFASSLVQKERYMQHESPHDLEVAFFVMISQILTQDRRRLANLLKQKGGRRHRIQLQKLCLAKAVFLGDVCGIFAEIASRYPFKFEKIMLQPSTLILSISARTDEIDDRCQTQSVLIELSESLTWLWDFLRRNGAADNDLAADAAGSGADASTTVGERKMARALEVPVAAALVAFCGAGTNSKSLHLTSTDGGEGNSSNFGRTEVIDSAESAFDFAVDSEEEEEEETNKKKKEVSSEKVIPGRRELKRSLMAMVHASRCIVSVFGSVRDIYASSGFLEGLNDVGSLLPIVVCRVLHRATDILFNLGDGATEDEVIPTTKAPDKTWEEVFPLGTQKIGAEMDAMLHKAYFCLYGFHLTTSNSQTKESAAQISGSKDVIKNAIYTPESWLAATSVYKCIKRSYPSNGKRLPLRSALLCVTRALPEKQETPRSKAIKKYIFSGRIDSNTAGGFVAEKFPKEPANFPLWVFDDATENQDSEVGDRSDNSERNNKTKAALLEHVWKSISNDLQRGPIPRFGIESATPVVLNKDAGGTESEEAQTRDRERMVQYEMALWEKVKGIVDFLDFVPDNTRGWFAAAQCLAAKSDCIRERIAIVEEGHRELKFFPLPRTTATFETGAGLPLDILEDQEAKWEAQEKNNWLPYIGTDLSVYAQYPWSSFSTLKTSSSIVADQLRSAYKEEDEPTDEVAKTTAEDKKKAASLDTSEEQSSNNLKTSQEKTHSDGKSDKMDCDARETTNDAISKPNSTLNSTAISTQENNLEEAALTDCDVWEELESTDAVAWQTGWGSLFASALRTMAYRCYNVAYFLAGRSSTSGSSENANSSQEAEDDSSDVVAEVCETIGTSVYSELQGGWRYGYPLQRQSNAGIRNLAKRALALYSESLDLSSAAKSDEEELWGIFFMTGKCYEKIAKTYRKERFVDNINFQRRYEFYMAKAFQNYIRGLEEVRKDEKEGNLPDLPMGGSTHGSTELLHRIHACRLKVLLDFVRSYGQGSTVLREAEALRLVSMYWESEPVAFGLEEDLQESRWEALLDIVFGLASCRRKKHFFHRSVFRHAQAILWAPFVCHPEITSFEIIREESSSEEAEEKIDLSILSNEYKNKIFVNRASKVMSQLFDKKRSQLCATWITTPAVPLPFEELNESARKYDTIRLKSICAYIECLRVCGNLDSLRTFMSWTTTCTRDLPALYAASARADGGVPRHSLIRDNMLEVNKGFVWFVRRWCNLAIAECIKGKLDDTQKNRFPGAAQGGNKREHITQLLGYAYNAFLRLHCNVEYLTAWSNRTHCYNIPEIDTFLCAFQDLKRDKTQSDLFEDVPLKATTEEEWLQKLSLLQAAISKCRVMFAKNKKRTLTEGEKSGSKEARTDAYSTSAKQQKKKRKVDEA